MLEECPSRLTDSEPSADMWIVDAVTAAEIQRLHRLIASVGTSRIVVYGTLTPESMRAVLKFVRAGVRHVLIAGVDDNAEQIRGLLNAVRGDSLATRFGRRLAIRTQRLPRALQRVIADVIARPATYAGVADVCAATGAPQRSCHRWVTGSGLVSLRRLIQAARVLHAAPLLQRRRLTLDVVAASVGNTSAKQLSADIRAVLGGGLSLAAGLTDDEMLERASAYVCRTALAVPDAKDETRRGANWEILAKKHSGAVSSN